MITCMAAVETIYLLAVWAKTEWMVDLELIPLNSLPGKTPLNSTQQRVRTLAMAKTMISIENVNGGGGNDKITGNKGKNTLNGEKGNDWLYGHLGNDVIDGGSGTDTTQFSSRKNTIKLNTTKSQNTGDGKDRLISIENVSGGGGNDKITGNKGKNTLNGEKGNDWLYGHLGNDVIDGGSGTDTAQFSSEKHH